MKALLLALVLVACDGPTEIGVTVVEFCGLAPSAPGWSVAVDNGRVTMTVEHYNALTAWREDVAAWSDCATNIP